MSKKKPTKKEAQEVCTRWNQENPPGTEVTLTRDNGQIEHTKTRGEAYVCESGYPVIFLENVRGYYLLERVQPKQTATAATE